ncbi:MAG: hypothetical protein NC341_10915 [Blautia sp.]|nr:hypothetical protein [Blautia sp.]MCM1202408.1 hypothetical protein [Bacteroides fragilis]
MKKTIIKSVYLIIIFFAALFSVSAVMNQGNTDMTMEMGEASFPVVTMRIGEYPVNRLHGYAGDMDTSYLRDTLLPIGSRRNVAFTIDTYGNKMEALSFEVRSIDGERLVESTEIEKYQETEEQIRCEITLKDLISEKKEYMLVLFLKPEGKDTIRYYTRIVQSEEMYIQEKLAYVLDFHERTFNREAAAELTKYLESNAEGDNSTLNKVTIHSSFNQVTWADLKVEKVTEPVVDIKELEERTGSFQLEYMVSTRSGREKTCYHVKEYYRIRYTPDRMYLLDFDREMTQIFDESANVYANDKIMLGIVDKDVKMQESDGGNVFAFISSNKLYSYNVADQKLARLFSFYSDDVTDPRGSYTRHQIKIMNVDEAGNVVFLIYGYMNRGRHEGEVGVSVYFYNSMTNTVEEQIYIPYDRSYELLKSDVEKLSYINKSGICYLMLEGNVYAVDLQTREYEIVVSGLTEENYKVSKSNKMLVWQEGGAQYSSTVLRLLNLGTGKETEIAAGSGEYISLLGFMEEDLIYGLARQEDIISDHTGNTTFPMYCLRIQGDSGKLLKTYRERGIYVVDSAIADNQITLSRVVWEEEKGEYVPTSDDQIMSTEKVSSGSNGISSVTIEIYETIQEIVVKEPIDTKALKILTPKEVLFEGKRELTVEKGEAAGERYYVYGKDGIEGIFSDPGKAVIYAYENVGVIVDDEGDYIWKRTARSTRNQIMAIEGEQVTEQNTSLSVCLNTILKYEGVSRRTEYLLEQGNTIPSILEAGLGDVQVLDLSGCSLDAVLYYVNMDIPVLATLQDGNAVLIVGFNELNIVVMDPLTGTVYKKGMNDSTQWLLENGNHFITYVRNEED